MRKKNRIFILMMQGLMVLGVLLGIAFMLFSYFVTSSELTADRNSNLNDIVLSTDRTIALLLEHTSSELNNSVRLLSDAEEAYLKTGDTEPLFTSLRSLPMLDSEHVSSLLLLKDREILLTSDRSDLVPYSFPFGISQKTVSLCVSRDGENYLAVFAEKNESGLTYVALIDFDLLYRQIVGDSLTEDYWLVLFNRTFSFFLQSDAAQPQVYRMEIDKALARKDGISAVVESELTGEFSETNYRYRIDGRRQQNCTISSLPTAVNRNGVFTVAIAVNNRQFEKKIGDLFARTVMFSVLIVSFVSALLLYVVRANLKNAEIREQVELLKVQNDEMQQLLDKQQELAHHQRLETIGTLTSGIAHEFNNLLTPIMGYSILCMEKLGPGNEEIMDDLSEIYEASSKAKSLVSRVSALSRKNNEASLRLFSPDAVFEKVREMAQPSRPENVTLQYDYHCPDPCLYANETQVGRLLLNLVINAFHAMEEKGGTLTVSTQTDGKTVTFGVEDTGKGMTEEVQSHIFEPFFTTKGNGHGTGLGLAIVKQIVEEHGGTIGVESRVGEGTRFFVSLPCEGKGKTKTSE